MSLFLSFLETQTEVIQSLSGKVQDPGHYGFQVIIRKKSKSDETNSKAAVGQNKQNSKKYTTLIKITQRRVTDALVLLASLELAVLSVSLV